MGHYCISRGSLLLFKLCHVLRVLRSVASSRVSQSVPPARISSFHPRPQFECLFVLEQEKHRPWRIPHSAIVYCSLVVLRPHCPHQR
jgi:hypothetical protein